jgi:hypothetical protein
MQRLVVHSSLPRMERFDALPDGWKLDRTWGSPEYGYAPICNGKSLLNGGRKGLLKVEKPTVKESLTVAITPPEPELERIDLTPSEIKVAYDDTGSIILTQSERQEVREMVLQDPPQRD